MTQKKRINFNAPAELIEQADELAELLGYSRTDLLVEGLRTQINELVEQQTTKQQVTQAFFEGDLSRDAVAKTVGPVEAARLAALKESLERNKIPAPASAAADPPADEEFYENGGPVTTADIDAEQTE